MTPLGAGAHGMALPAPTGRPAALQRDDRGVVCGEGVPTTTGRPLGESCGQAGTPAVVLTGRDGFQMRGVHAGRRATEVIECHADRNRPNQELIGRTVSGLAFAISADVGIAVFRHVATPDPAFIRSPARRRQMTPKRAGSVRPAMDVAIGIGAQAGAEPPPVSGEGADAETDAALLAGALDR